MLGLVVQRAMIVCLTACIPIITLWWNMESLLGLMHQSPEVAEGASRYLRLLSPALIASTVSNVLAR